MAILRIAHLVRIVKLNTLALGNKKYHCNNKFKLCVFYDD